MVLIFIIVAHPLPHSWGEPAPGLSGSALGYYPLKGVLGHSAYWACPVLGQVLKEGPGLDLTTGVAHSGIVDVITSSALPPLYLRPLSAQLFLSAQYCRPGKGVHCLLEAVPGTVGCHR